MRIFKFSPVLIVLIAVFFAFSSTNTFAQRNIKAKERIEQVKKVKLLEVLELDEKAADKFLAKYTAWENKIKDKREANETSFVQIRIAQQTMMFQSIENKMLIYFIANDEHIGILHQGPQLRNIIIRQHFTRRIVW